MDTFDTSLLISRHKYGFGAPADESTAYRFDNGQTQRITELVDRFGERLNTTETRTVGILFFKKYSPLFAGALYAWLRYRHPLDLRFRNVRILLNGANLKYALLNEKPLPLSGDRADSDDSDEAYFRHLFLEHAAPVVDAVAGHTGAAPAALWSMIAYSLTYWKQEWLLETQSAELRQRIGQWFDNAAGRFAPELLTSGAAKAMAYPFRSVDDPLHDGRRIMIRRTCCLNYRLSAEDNYCSTCPLISDERRLEKLKNSHAGG